MKYPFVGPIVLFFLWSLGCLEAMCLGLGWASVGLEEGCLDHLCCFWECEKNNAKREIGPSPESEEVP